MHIYHLLFLSHESNSPSGTKTNLLSSTVRKRYVTVYRPFIQRSDSDPLPAVDFHHFAQKQDEAFKGVSLKFHNISAKQTILQSNKLNITVKTKTNIMWDLQRVKFKRVVHTIFFFDIIFSPSCHFKPP